MDRDFERNPDDEREVDLADETEPQAPAPTLDPEEKVEANGDDEPVLDDERPA